MQNLQNDQKTKTTKNDQNGGRQIQENTLLKRDEVRQPPRISKPELLKAAMEWKMLIPTACDNG